MIKNKQHILIIDDEVGIRFSLQGILEDEGYTVSLAANGEEGLLILKNTDINLIILDIWLQEYESNSLISDGLALLKHIKSLSEYAFLPIIMISGHGTVETAVSALKLGAYDFIEKPLALDAVLNTIERALEVEDLKIENQNLKSALAQSEHHLNQDLIGNSPQMLAFKASLAAVAPTDVWVLITGENGTGKELAAKALHKGSKRAHEPLIALNCAAIPEELIESELFGHEKGAFTGAESRIGKFELAHKGTLFLDEIGDMSLKTQAKILRILQEQAFQKVGGSKTIYVDVRIIAATNKNLEEAMEKGLFRSDLYYRLRGFPLHLPPLRERKGDIPLLVAVLSAQIAMEMNLDPPLLSQSSILLMEQAYWQGNIRELRHVLEQLAILYPHILILPEILEKHINLTHSTQNFSLPTAFHSFLDYDYKTAKQEFETWYLQEKLKETDNNITKLAELVGLERSYLHKKLKQRL